MFHINKNIITGSAPAKIELKRADASAPHVDHQLVLIPTVCYDLFQAFKSDAVLTRDTCSLQAAILATSIEGMLAECDLIHGSDATKRAGEIRDLANVVEKRLAQREFKEDPSLLNIKEHLDTLAAVISAKEVKAEDYEVAAAISASLGASIIPDHFQAPKSQAGKDKEKDKEKDDKATDTTKSKDAETKEHEEKKASPKSDVPKSQVPEKYQDSFFANICDISPATAKEDVIKKACEFLAANKDTYINLCKQHSAILEDSKTFIETAEQIVGEKQQQAGFEWNAHLATMKKVLADMKKQINTIDVERKSFAAFSAPASRPSPAVGIEGFDAASTAFIADLGLSQPTLERQPNVAGHFSYGSLSDLVGDAGDDCVAKLKERLSGYFDRTAMEQAFCALDEHIKSGVYDKNVWTKDLCDYVSGLIAELEADELRKTLMTEDDEGFLKLIKNMVAGAIASLQATSSIPSGPPGGPATSSLPVGAPAATVKKPTALKLDELTDDQPQHLLVSSPVSLDIPRDVAFRTAHSFFRNIGGAPAAAHDVDLHAALEHSEMDEINRQIAEMERKAAQAQTRSPR